ncbi:MAG: hypothetical protein U9R48_07235, partial [Chloroflexota bacterium]|nr:hypothetical protein [Chloroflexota bacterium]
MVGRPMVRKGEGRRDLASGSLPRQILGLSLPSIVELALLSVGGVLHAFWMGRVGDLALAA